MDGSIRKKKKISTKTKTSFNFAQLFLLLFQK